MSTKAHEPSAMENMANAAGERAKNAVDSGVDACNAVSEKARKLGRNADGYVRENPWMAIGISTGIGVVIGLFLSRRRS